MARLLLLSGRPILLHSCAQGQRPLGVLLFQRALRALQGVGHAATTPMSRAGAQIGGGYAFPLLPVDNAVAWW